MRPTGGSIGGGGPPHPRFPSQAPVGAARHDSRYGGGPPSYDAQMRHSAAGRGGYPGGGPPPHVMGGMGMPAYGAPPGGPGARFCVIKLKGLPFGVKDYEIGLFLVGIVLWRSFWEQVFCFFNMLVLVANRGSVFGQCVHLSRMLKIFNHIHCIL